MTSEITTLLQLLQLSDSALPIGGYSNSWGLETWVQKGRLTSAAEVESALQTLLLSSIAPTEGVACGLAHRSCGREDQSSFRTINAYLSAGRWCPEQLEASLRMGDRLKQLSAKIAWAGSVPPGDTHHCTVFGWLACAAGISQEQTVAAYLYSSMASLMSACVRLVPLGHTDGQLVLTRLRACIEPLVATVLAKEIDDIGGFAPMHEWACKQHETLYSRLFQS